MSFIDEIKQSRVNSLIKYSQTDIVNEVKSIYKNSGIDETISRIKTLEEEQKKLREQVENKWYQVEKELFTISSNIYKLSLSNNERIELCRKIESFIGSQKGILGMEGFKLSYRMVHNDDILKNPI